MLHVYSPSSNTIDLQTSNWFPPLILQVELMSKASNKERLLWHQINICSFNMDGAWSQKAIVCNQYINYQLNLQQWHDYWINMHWLFIHWQYSFLHLSYLVAVLEFVVAINKIHRVISANLWKLCQKWWFNVNKFILKQNKAIYLTKALGWIEE